jgi:multiple sugar transport system substrate-binding protein
MFFNKDIFDKANLPYPDGNLTWDKYIETAKKLTVDSNNDGNIEQFGTARAWWPLYLFWNGANIFTPDLKKCGLSDPAAIDGLQKMVDMTVTDKIAPAQKDLDAQDDYHMFMTGRIAMYPIGPWAINDFNTITTFKWDIADMPIMKKQATFLFGNAYSMMSASKNQEAAWEFMKFATGEEGDLIRQQAGYEIAPNKKIAETQFLKSLEGKSPEHASIFLSATSYAQTVPVVAHWTEIGDAINNELNLALLGKQTVKQAVDKACPAVDTLLAEDN